MNDIPGTAIDRLPSDLAIPRDPAGAPVFAEPWEARVFGMVVSLHQAGAFEWKSFQELLVDEIARSEASGHPRPYYLNWAMAAERLFETLAFASRAAVDARVEALRPEDRTIRLR
jgi:nitrile hydratase accessory protein